MKASTTGVLLTLVAAWLCGRTALAQYIHQPSPPTAETIPPPSAWSGNTVPSLLPNSQPAQSVMGGSAQPMIGGSAQPMIGGSAQPMIGGSPQPVIGGTVPGPSPTYGGAVLPPPGTWDPYAPPGAGQSPTLLPKDYYPTLPGASEENRLQRLIDEIRLDYHLFSSRGSNGFGINDLDLSVTFAFPLFHNTETPLLITPGFACHWWQGPKDAPPGSLFADLPPRVYDAYLGAAWNPQITPVVGGELAFRVGVYSDFHKVTSDSIRYTGHGLLTLALSPSFRLKGGIVYYDRVRIKMLPAAGVVWTPNQDWTFDIFFPAPKITRRLSNYGNTQWWLYARGEYGGGSWTVFDSFTGEVNQLDYNDLRCSLGLEFNRMDRIRGLLEVGVAFDRELVQRWPWETFDPSTTIFLRAGLMR